MKKNIWKLLAAIISIAVVLSFSFIIVSADETTGADEAGTEEVVDETGSETDEGTDAAQTDASTDAEETTGTSSSSSNNNSSTSTKTNHYGIATLIIVAVILVAVLIWVLRDRERAAKLWRSFKSEFKKIVWADRHETLKNTALVIVAIVVFAVVLGLVDYLLSLLIVTIGTII